MIEMKDSRIAWIGLIPNQWACMRFKYVAKNLNNKAKNNSNYIGLENVESWTGRLLPSQNEAFVAEGDSLYVKPRNVLFGKLRPYLAKCLIVETEGCCSSEFLVIEERLLSAEYLRYMMLSPQFIEEVNMSTYGAKMPRASWNYISNMVVPYPPDDVQKKIVDFLDKKCSQIDTIITKQETIIEKLKDYKLSKITEAVTKGLNPNVNMKDSGVKWIGLIPSHWAITKMKYQGQFINGYAFPSSAFCDAGFRVLKISNIQPMRIDWTDTSYVNIDDYDVDKMDLYLVKKNDLIFALTRPIINEGIKVALADFDDRVYLNQRNAVFKGGSNISAKWQYYLMQNCMFIQEFSLYIDGTGQQPNISTREISNITIPLPSLDEQKEITDALDFLISDIDHKICCIQELITKLTEYKKSLIYETITGKMGG